MATVKGALCLAPEAGLYYMRARWYEPHTGRFTQEDPIGLAGGLNLYGFAGGDPVNFWDPFGLCEDEQGKWRRCKVTWSAEASDTNITNETRAAAQQLADLADVDLVLSSGRRAQGTNCSRSRHNCGKAFDIKSINGVDIGDDAHFKWNAIGLILRVQHAAMGMSQVRENYGPALLLKADVPGGMQLPRPRVLSGYYDILWLPHQNHIHISIH